MGPMRGAFLRRRGWFGSIFGLGPADKKEGSATYDGFAGCRGTPIVPVRCCVGLRRREPGMGRVGTASGPERGFR
jgi:hypothetical protein